MANMKYIENDFHFVYDMVAKKKLQVWFIATNDPLVDVFTKPFSNDFFSFFNPCCDVDTFQYILKSYLNVLQPDQQ
jgi:hypothetical protein